MKLLGFKRVYFNIPLEESCVFETSNCENFMIWSSSSELVWIWAAGSGSLKLNQEQVRVKSEHYPRILLSACVWNVSSDGGEPLCRPGNSTLRSSERLLLRGLFFPRRWLPGCRVFQKGSSDFWGAVTCAPLVRLELIVVWRNEVTASTGGLRLSHDEEEEEE